MRWIITVTGAAAWAMVITIAAEAAPPCKVADLAWMQGAWRSHEAGSNGEERWTMAAGDRLMGSSWFFQAGAPGGFAEALTIQQDGGAIVLRIRHFNPGLTHALEPQDAPMTLLAARCGPTGAVFDGQGDRAGEHMTYRRDGDTLTFIGDFIHAGKPVRDEVAFRRGAD
jgi:hypothetical protein